MFIPVTRSFWKQALVWTRVKLVFTRVTLTKYTTLYFFLALVYCIVGVVLQGVAYADNVQAGGIVDGVLQSSNISGLVVHTGDHLAFCTGLPNVPGSNCTIIQPTKQLIKLDNSTLERRMHKVTKKNGELIGVDLGDGVILSVPCVQSLLWLHDTLRDSRREDLVLLVFQIWLFALSFVSILNESLPHLVAALASHALATGWEAFRVQNSRYVQNLYATLIVDGTCNNIDFLGNWWDVRNSHTTPTLVLNAIALVGVLLLSCKLYKVYARQSFKRVGASAKINKVYKLVLILSVCIQLAGFFVLASTIMWIDKASVGTIQHIARHLVLYKVSLAIMCVLVVPWGVLGWMSVRREQPRQFLVFFAMSLAFLTLSTLYFTSDLYRFIFGMWPLFATMTITSYVLIVAVSVMAVFCRLHFGKGLPQFLKQTEAPEGADFAPVYISSLSYSSDDTEKGGRRLSDASFESKFVPASEIEKPERARTLQKKPSVRTSVFSDPTRATVKLSSTPPVAQELLSQVPESLERPPPLPSINHKPSETAAMPRSSSRPTHSGPTRSLSQSKLKKGVIGLPSNPRHLQMGYGQQRPNRTGNYI